MSDERRNRKKCKSVGESIPKGLAITGHQSKRAHDNHVVASGRMDPPNNPDLDAARAAFLSIGEEEVALDEHRIKLPSTYVTALGSLLVLPWKLARNPDGWLDLVPICYWANYASAMKVALCDGRGMSDSDVRLILQLARTVCPSTSGRVTLGKKCLNHLQTTGRNDRVVLLAADLWISIRSGYQIDRWETAVLPGLIPGGNKDRDASASQPLPAA